MNMRRFLRNSLAAIALTLVGAFAVWMLWLPLPNTLQPSQSKVLFAKNGELLAASIAADQQWRFPASEQLPEKYRTALLTFEDRRFYYHPGIDPIAIARASVSNLRAGRVVSGGSTLTMQLARMLLQDQPRTLRFKAMEALLALKLEWHFSKEQLLQHYASHAPFGGNLIGLDTASWRYFNRQPQQLSWAEAALLAVLPNSPALIHPGRNREQLRSKRNRLLRQLHNQKHLSATDLQLAQLEPLPNGVYPLPRLSPHLLLSASQQHPNDHAWHTTLNAELQRNTTLVAERQGARLADAGVNNLAIVVIDNRSLELHAYLGNYSQQGVSDAVDIASRPRSTGSILKPLLYAAMLDAGEILPNTLVPDTPSNYNGFTPENYDHDYRGAVPAHQALARSLNIPAVHLLQRYGAPRFHQDLQQLGLTTLFRPAEDYGLSLILGGAEANLYEITAIYAQLMASARDDHVKENDIKANEVKAKEGTTLRWLTNRDASLTGSKHQPLFSQGSAWLTLEALQDVSRPGVDNYWRQFASSQTIAWKTGTSYGLRDAWAVGSNNHYTVGVWAGNAGGEGIAGLSGLNSAAPVLFEMFQQLPRSSWPAPPLLALKQIETCIADGFLAGNECASESSWAPRHSNFQQQTPYHRMVQLNANGDYRVHGNCEAISRINRQTWLVLPPLIEHHWRKHHPEYQTLPPWRPDCVAGLADLSVDMPMEIVYPSEGAQVFIPRELSGEKGRTVFKAAHKQPTSQVHWHIDDRYITTTEVFHEVALNIEAGWHKLVLVDDQGFRQERWFKISSAQQ